MTSPGRGLVCMFQDFQDGVLGTNQGGLHFPRQRSSNAQKSNTHQPRPWHWGQKARLWLDAPTMMSIGQRRLGRLGHSHGPPNFQMSTLLHIDIDRRWLMTVL
ncbi:uncharacterized protein FTOL_09527 [Fusarium torulosum]|uniref:Uncharacterized protein n=1 Tax=Fusarium torulosum TaxID=33205 RepID=A0AAE8MEI3_9HYPO|nr:uncharacterized protein FTOL_09527 [Fusarium torulosum]